MNRYFQLSLGLLALLVNTVCFGLLYQLRTSDVNLKASWICSRNDMLANIGVILSAFLVNKLNTAWPDWVIGSLIALIVIHSSKVIISEAKTSFKETDSKDKSCIS